MYKQTVIFSFLPLLFLSATSQVSDRKNIREHISVDAEAFEGGIIPHSKEVRKVLQSRYSGIYSLGAGYQTLPSDSSIFASDYNYPLFGLRLSMADFSHVKLAEDSRIGNIYTLYGRIEHPLLKSSNWQFNYLLDAGLSYASDPQNWKTKPIKSFYRFKTYGLCRFWTWSKL